MKLAYNISAANISAIYVALIKFLKFALEFKKKIPKIFIKKNDRLISLAMKQGSFLDKIQLLLTNLIDQTFKETINFLLFIAKDQ